MGLGCIIASSVDRQLLVVARSVADHDRALCIERAPIPAARGIPDRPGIGERDRLGQLGRHPGRQRIAPGHGVSTRPDRKLCWGPLRACRICCAGSNSRGGRRARDTGEVQRGGASGGSGGVGLFCQRLLHREAVLDKEPDRDEIAPAANLDALHTAVLGVRTGPISKPSISLTGTEGSTPLFLRQGSP